MDPAQEIARRAAALESSPLDLERWDELARVLADEGHDEAAIRAFAAMGEAANRLGQVALAVACARQLVELEASKAATELVGAIAKCHCRDSSLIDASLRPSPLLPPPSAPIAPAAIAKVDVDAALELATTALAEAEAAVMERAPKSLPATPLVGVLSRDELRELATVVEERRVEAGAIIVDMGEPATSLFWVARGHLEVTRNEHDLGDLRANAFFGEIALVASTSRTARVTARSNAWLLEIPAESLEKLARSSPRLAKVLANHARARILSNVMRASGLFSRLSEDERRTLLPRFEVRIVDAGDVLIDGGTANDTLYVIASGTVEVRDGDAVVAVLSVGDGVGEQSLLSRKPALFDVVATSRSVVLGIERSQFDDLVVAHPGLLAEAYRLLVTREQQSRELIVHDASDLVI